MGKKKKANPLTVVDQAAPEEAEDLPRSSKDEADLEEDEVQEAPGNKRETKGQMGQRHKREVKVLHWSLLIKPSIIRVWLLKNPINFLLIGIKEEYREDAALHP